MSGRVLLVLAAAALAGSLACVLEGAGASGKRCASAQDCPEPLVCVSARPIGRTCEALPLPIEGNFDVDAGVAFWCNEVETVMQAHCVSCHSVPPLPPAPATFRLDDYEPDGGVPGAKSQAERIYVRMAVTKDMPPFGTTEPTPEELQLVTAWFRTGAPLCGDAPDAGDMGDAGP